MHLELLTLSNDGERKNGENDCFVVASNVNGYNLKINGSGIVSVNGKDKDSDNGSVNNVAFDVNCYFWSYMHFLLNVSLDLLQCIPAPVSLLV
jgi:hypothetical protein